MNTFKTTFLLIMMTMLLMLVGSMFGGKNGMTIMLVISILMNFGSYWFSDKIILSMYGAREVDINTAPSLVSIVANLAQRANLPMPKVYIMDTSTPNAFATGRNPEHAAIAVTTGIMQALDDVELSGVLAHELGHVKNRDTLISTLVATIAGVITWIANMAQWAAIFGMGRNNDDNEGGSSLITSLFMIVLAPIAATIIQLAISRSREFQADETGAKISGQPLALASALSKIENYSHNRQLPSATPSTAHMFIINPLSGSGSMFFKLFSTHPATEERIQRLRSLAQKMH